MFHSLLSYTKFLRSMKFSEVIASSSHPSLPFLLQFCTYFWIFYFCIFTLFWIDKQNHTQTKKAGEVQLHVPFTGDGEITSLPGIVQESSKKGRLQGVYPNGLTLGMSSQQTLGRRSVSSMCCWPGKNHMSYTTSFRLLYHKHSQTIAGDDPLGWLFSFCQFSQSDPQDWFVYCPFS